MISSLYSSFSKNSRLASLYACSGVSDMILLQWSRDPRPRAGASSRDPRPRAGASSRDLVLGVVHVVERERSCLMIWKALIPRNSRDIMGTENNIIRKMFRLI